MINREPEKAARYLAEAIRWNPFSADYLSRFGLALVRFRKRAEALACARRAVELCESDDSDTADTCGMIFLLCGDFESARSYFDRAISLRPDYEYFRSHRDWLDREHRDFITRKTQGKFYTPLYLRQRQQTRYFDEKEIPVPTQLNEYLDETYPAEELLALSYGKYKEGRSEMLDEASKAMSELEQWTIDELRSRTGEIFYWLVKGTSEKRYEIKIAIINFGESLISVHLDTNGYDGLTPLHSVFEIETDS